MKTLLVRLWATYFRPLDGRTATLLLAAPTLLVIWDFHCRTKHYRRYLADVFRDFPLHEVYPRVYFGVAASVVLFLVPVLIIRFGFRDRLKDYGLGLGDWRKGLFITVVFLAVMVPVVVIAARFGTFQNTYPLGKHAADSLAHLVLYETSFLLYFIAWEFFFRGYMLFGLERKLGLYAVFVQSIPFVLLHVRKPEPEALGAVVAGIALGILGLETRSCWYGVFLHFLIALCMDLAALQARGVF